MVGDVELSATFGAGGGGVAAVLLQEAAVATLVAALPLIAAAARARRDALTRRYAAEASLELREEADALRAK